MIDDIFCKILKGELNAEFVYRDDDVAVIRDIHPQAPVHLLVIPVRHMDSVGDAQGYEEVLGKLIMVAHRVAAQQGLDKGYRIIINEGEHGGKLVPHLHAHLLGGKHLGAKIIADSR